MAWPATPEFIGAGTAVASANNVANPTTLSPNAPTRAEGDLLVLVTNSRSRTATVATPSDWNIVSGFPIASATTSGGKFYVFTRIADNTTTDNSSFQWSGLTTGTSGDSCSARILAFRYAIESLDGSLATTQDQASTTSFTINACSPSASTGLWLGMGMRVHDTAHTFTVTNFTGECADTHTTSGTGHGTITAWKALTSSGSTGTSTVTPSNTTSARTLTTAAVFQTPAMGDSRQTDLTIRAFPIPPRRNL